MIHIVGLGPGDAERLPLRAFSLLTGDLPVYLRTARHPTLTTGRLADAFAGRAVVAFDDEYESNPTFDDTLTTRLSPAFCAFMPRRGRLCTPSPVIR